MGSYTTLFLWEQEFLFPEQQAQKQFCATANLINKLGAAHWYIIHLS